MSEQCKECGCVCTKCLKYNKFEKRHSDVHLHAEIEHLRQSLKEKDTHIVKMETQFLDEADKFPNGELASMKEEVRTWQDKFSRLFEAHKRVQKVNQSLEDKLLKIVDKCETEKGAFTKDIATLSHRLADANYTIHRLSQDNAKYRNDVNLAIQLLQCKPSNFVGHKYDSLPSEVQAKVKSYIAQKSCRSSDMSPADVRSITVPISTFPPTAMVYNISKPTVEKHSDDESDDNKPPVDIVSAAIMAKVLEDRERERIFAKHCDTCVCHKTILMVDSECQTIPLCDLEDKNFIPPINQINGHTSIRQTTSTQGTKLNASLTQSQIMLERQSLKSNIIKIKNKSSKIDSRAPLIPRRSDILTNINSVIDETNANPVDIINDRIWKNTWMNKNTKFDNSTRSGDVANNQKTNETHLDVISNRDWTKGNPMNNINTSKVTLIEVTNKVNAQSPEIAASPSFSSESVVISSSEPSSSSSDLIHSINEKRRTFNNNSSSSNESRNCLLKAKREGTKNILLDNARTNGNYQTVVYTSSGSMSCSPSANLPNKSTTALVHNNITKSTRSLSTSSDEAFPILPHDATQLQRVAEWVQLSVSTSDGKETINKKVSPEISTEKIPCTLIDMSSAEPKIERHTNIRIPVDLNTNNQSGEKINVIKEKKPDEHVIQVKDLISFDSTNEDEGETEDDSSKEKNDTEGEDYEVKITKEMEETYLKLAASLDPVSLSLSTACTNPDITIEKYRKDHKKNQMQKIHEKSGSGT